MLWLQLPLLLLLLLLSPRSFLLSLRSSAFAALRRNCFARLRSPFA